MYHDLNNSLKNLVKLTQAELDSLYSRIRILKLDKNSCWIHEGQIATDIAFVSKGYLRIYFQNDGIEITRDISSVHSFFTALTSFITQKPSYEIVSAITDCELLLIGRKDLDFLYEHFPSWQTIGRRVVEEMFVRSQHRIYSLITVCAEERYRILLKKKADMIQNVPLQYIASYLGITQQSLSRLRKKISQP